MQNPSVNKVSPRGNYRMWEFIPALALGITGLWLIGSDWGGENIAPWFLPVIKICAFQPLAIIMTYYTWRRLVPQRTHELDTPEQKARRGDFLCLSIAIVTAGVLILSK